MASNRHLGRILALQTLYECDFRSECGDKKLNTDEVLRRNIDRYDRTVDDKDFVKTVVKGVLEHQKDIDAILQPIAPEWPISQIARVDRAVLRLALFELLFGDETPPKVVINEAVELAKAFGGDNSSKFINGVLGTAYKNSQGKKDSSSKDD